MTLINILSMGSERAVADLAVDAIGEDKEKFSRVLDLCLLEQYPISMRAARVIQLVCEHQPDLIYPYIEEILPKVLASKIDGVKRNFLKIFAEFIDLNRLEDAGYLLDRCFTLAMDASENPAPRIYSMMIIEKLSIRFPEIRNEFREVLLFISEDEKPSIQCYIKRRLKSFSGLTIHDSHY